jgi:hypothetical protein
VNAKSIPRHGPSILAGLKGWISSK